MSGIVRACLLCFAVAISSSATAQPQRRFSIDDLLMLEDVGAAKIDPTGHWLVYERAPRYDQLPDYSVGRLVTWVRPGGRLMIVDLTAEQPSPKLLFKPDPKKMYWIDSFSPGGQSIAFYAAEGPHVTEGVYQIESKRLVSFDAAPRVDEVTGHTSIWLSETTLLYDATAEGEEPSFLSFRGYTGDALAAAWHKTWQGKEPSFGVVESHADGGGHNFLPGRLIQADVKSGQFRVLASGQFDNLKLSPDGRYLAALKQAEMIQPEPNRLATDWLFARSVLMLFNLAKSGEAAAVAPGLEVFPGTLEWAEDADRLALFAWKSGAGVQSGIFYGFDADTGALTPYPHTGLDLASERERGWYQRPERAVWIGDRLALVARATQAGAPPQFTYRDVTVLGHGIAPPKADWFLLDANGHSENLTAQFKNVSAVPISATGKQLYLLADGNVWRIEPGQIAVNLTAKVALPLRHSGPPWGSRDEPPFQSAATLETVKDNKALFVMVDLKSGAVAQVQSPSLHSSLMTTSSKAAAVMFREIGENGSALLLSRAQKRTVTLDRYNTFLKQIAKDRWITIHYTSVGGHDIQSCLLLPPDYKPGSRYPAIVEVYPGRTAECHMAGYYGYVMGAHPSSYSMHLLAAKGYVVLEASAPSTLIQASSGPLARLTDVVVDGANALVEQGYADSDRIGLLGLSQGGFSSLWVTTQTNRFKATVSINGWSDFFSHYFEHSWQSALPFNASEVPFEFVRYEDTTGTDEPIGRTPWEDPMAYIRNSAIYGAPNVNTPVLMIHSDLDIFGLTQYDEMYAAFYRLRKEAKFICFWGEGHSPSSPANIRYMWQQIFQWYAKYLGKDSDSK
ncbi:MAG: alpha/beta hydrolase family protein [Terriglobales bacterium]